MLKVWARNKGEEERKRTEVLTVPMDHPRPPFVPPSTPVPVPALSTTPDRSMASSVAESNPSCSLIWSSPRRHGSPSSAGSTAKVADSSSAQCSLFQFFSPSLDENSGHSDASSRVCRQYSAKELFSPGYQKDGVSRILRARRSRGFSSRARSGSEPLPLGQRKLEEFGVSTRSAARVARLERARDVAEEESDAAMSPPPSPSFDDYVRSAEEYSYEFPRDIDEEFDPICFIRNLRPIPHEILPRVPCLPKKTRSSPQLSVVLDLDETLVHCSTEPLPNADMSFEVATEAFKCTVHVRLRPFCYDFLAEASKTFEVIVFTASQSAYADLLLNRLDPERRLVRHRLFREACVTVEGNFLKDLRVLGRELAHTVIVDNSPQAFACQVDNGIPITSWFDDPNDSELPKLMKFLKSLAESDDVRPAIRHRFMVQDLVNERS